MLAAFHPKTKILVGDVMEQIKRVPDNYVDCIVTSPPYWGLRDYGTATWIGGNPKCDHQNHRPGSRRADGGAKYLNQRTRDGAGSMGGDCKHCGAKRVDKQIGLEPTLPEYVDKLVALGHELNRVLKPTGTFWLNLGDCYAGQGGTGQNRHWDSRNKKNFNVQKTLRARTYDVKTKDLCGVPWRVAFALQDSGWYLRSAITWVKPNPMPEAVKDRPTSATEMVFMLTKNQTYAYDADAIAERSLRFPTDSRAGKGNILYKGKRSANTEAMLSGQHWFVTVNRTRNARNVWTIATAPFKDAHFATMPPKLAERCIKAGCPKNGITLDPFGGSGTTAMVANQLGRHAILIELNPDYVPIIHRRLKQFDKIPGALFDAVDHEFVDKLIDHAVGLAAEDDDLLHDVQEWLVANKLLARVATPMPCELDECICKNQRIEGFGEYATSAICYRRIENPDTPLKRIRGRVKFYSDRLEYGFVIADGSTKDIFLHKRYLGNMTGAQLRDDSPVTFTVQKCEQGLRVTSILPIEESVNG